MNSSIFSKEQRRELSTIVNYLNSSDKELNFLGISMFRKSKTFRLMKTRSLFFKQGDKLIRISDLISRTSKEINENKKVNRTCLQMFEKLLSKNPSGYFIRIFINTAEIL